jgi:hypothetical protein
MANIARVALTKNWQNLEDVIEGFTPSADSKYEIQNVGNEDVQLYEGATAPTEERNGFVIPHNEVAKWTKQDGNYCFAKAKYDQATINVGSL